MPRGWFFVLALTLAVLAGVFFPYYPAWLLYLIIPAIFGLGMYGLGGPGNDYY